MPPGAPAHRTPAGGDPRPAAPGDAPDGAFHVDEAYREHAGVLFGYVLHAVGDRAEAEDVVQEVFTRAWRAAPRYDPGRASVRTWLFAIARNLVLDGHRARGRRPRTTSRTTDRADQAPAERAEPVAPGPEDGVVERLRVVEALARLSSEHRQVVVALHLEGRTYAELATATGVPVATLRTRMHYGLRAMRAVLDEHDDPAGAPGRGAATERDGTDGTDRTDRTGRWGGRG